MGVFYWRSFTGVDIMLTLRKYVRDKILSKPKQERLAIFDEACLNDIQYDIMCRRFINRPQQSVVEISLDIDMSVDGVNDNIARAYDSILGVLKCGIK